MSKHTPGPWKIQKEFSSFYLICNPDYSKWPIAEKILERDIHLIAAAPDLLEACIKANGYLAECARLGEMPDDAAYWCETQQALSRAIHKAKG